MIDVVLNTPHAMNEKPFPKFMTLKDEGGVFLFKNMYEATCIVLPNPDHKIWTVGRHLAIGINIEAFEDFQGSFTAKNV